MIGHNKSVEELEIKVIDYESKDKDSFLKQNPKYPISRLNFQKLNGFKLKNHLSAYKWIEFNGLIDETQKPIIKPSSPSPVQILFKSTVDTRDYFEVKPINKLSMLISK